MEKIYKTGLAHLVVAINNNRLKWDSVKISDNDFGALIHEALIQDDKFKNRYNGAYGVIVEFGAETQRKRLELWTGVYLKCIDRGLASDEVMRIANSSLRAFDRQFKINLED